jgi:hypothetical protein
MSSSSADVSTAPTGRGRSSRVRQSTKGKEDKKEVSEKATTAPISTTTTTTTAATSSSSAAEDDGVWVQCNDCDKWRSLPSTVDPTTLPDIWTCNLNIYDPERANCEAPEETFGKEEELQDLPLKAFFKVQLV